MPSKDQQLSRFIKWLLVSCLFVIICSYSVHAQTVNSNASTNPWHPHDSILPDDSIGTSQIQSLSTLPAPTYDEQLFLVFDQSSADFSYDVTAIAQNDSYGYGPAYLLNGLSNQNYWYQVGLSYDWPYSSGGYASGFNLNYEVFNSKGNSIYPTDGGGGLQSFSGPVNPSDLVQLNLYISAGVVYMTAYDLNTSATSAVSYANVNVHPTTFVTGGSSGFFTGLMTEWYHVEPCYGDELTVNYTENSGALASGWMCMDEWQPSTDTVQFIANEAVTFSSSPAQLQYYSSHGATEYGSAYQFTTGSIPEATQATFIPADASNLLSSSDYFQISYTSSGQNLTLDCHSGTGYGFNVDYGTNPVVSGVSADSTSTEEWALNSQNTSVPVAPGSISTFYYYDLLSQEVAYGGPKNGNIISPEITYNGAPLLTESGVVSVSGNSMLLPYLSQQSIWVLRGTNVSVTNDILGTADDRWATQTSSWAITQADQISGDITYYHQYQVTANYATADDSVPSSAPLLSGTQFGSNYQMPLSTTNKTTWLDENSQWLAANVTAPSGTEQWACSTGNSGTITQSISINPTYVHQYYLSVISSHPANVATSGSGWYTSGTTADFAVASLVNVSQGERCIFASWIGSGSGSYNGSSASGSCEMDAPITESASWNTQYYLTVISSFGSPTGSGWYDSGASATFGVTTPVSGGTGVQYLLNSWSGLGTGSYSGSAASNMLTINNAITETASWTTQYYLTVNNDGYGATTGSGWYNDGSSAQATVLSDTVSGGTGVQHVFSGWTDGASGAGSNSNGFIMDSPVTATATWTTQYQLTFAVSPFGCGSTTPAGNDVWVNSGPLSVSVTPNSGYTFSHWTSTGGSVTFNNPNASSTDANVNGPGTITATLVSTSSSTPTPSVSHTQTPSPSSSPSNSTKTSAAPSASPSLPPMPVPTPSSGVLIALMAVPILVIITLSLKKRKAKLNANGKRIGDEQSFEETKEEK